MLRHWDDITRAGADLGGGQGGQCPPFKNFCSVN